MTKENLDKIFAPESVAVIGATDKENSIIRTLTWNLLKKFEGRTYPVNPNRDDTFGVETFPSVTDLPEGVDLAFIATPAATVPDIVEKCGNAGIPATVIISSGFRENGPVGKKLEDEIKKTRKKYGMRILGPNSLGVLRPSKNLNATVSDRVSKPGDIAFISQSGALGPSILDQEAGEGVRFSSFVSVGNMIDIDFGDLIDYFGRDRETQTILMHVESVRNPKKFLSAAKSFAKNKPIILEKPGRYPGSSQAIISHIGFSTGEDMLYDALFKRSGAVRVQEVGDLFACSEALAHECIPQGPRLAIVTNAGGLGIMAADELLKYEGELADLSDETMNRLEDCLAPYTSTSNPIDVSSDASVEDYSNCISACLEDENVDGVMVIYAPQGGSSPHQLAKTLVKLCENSRKPIIAPWMGGERIQKSRNILRNGGVPTPTTPEQGVRIFMHTHEYLRNRNLLYETPEPLSANSIPLKHQLSQRSYLKIMVKRLLDRNRNVLTEEESKKFSQTYGIPTVETYLSQTPEKAANIAAEIGFPVVLKICSPDIADKSAVKGVIFNLESKEEVEKGFERIMENVKDHSPDAEIRGVTVQRQLEDIDYVLTLGTRKDPHFGSAILFGTGGIKGEIYQDTAVDFPPLNQVHAKRLVERTKIPKLLNKIEEDPLTKLKSLFEYLARYSQLIIDFSEIKEMKLDLAGTQRGFFVVDAHVTLDSEAPFREDEPHRHLIIEPYPLRYIKNMELRDGRTVTIRPVKPEDEQLVLDLFDTFSKETWRHRFFGPMKEITHEDMIGFTHVDYNREIAMVAELKENNQRKLIGIGRLITRGGEDKGEFAVVVGDPWQGLGLGEELVKSIVEIARDHKLTNIYGIIRKDNYRMLKLCEKLGFKREITYPSTIRISQKLMNDED